MLMNFCQGPHKEAYHTSEQVLPFLLLNSCTDKFHWSQAQVANAEMTVIQFSVTLCYCNSTAMFHYSLDANAIM